jgi:[acyl-carrier-protein] S-malonyltransferase
LPGLRDHRPLPLRDPQVPVVTNIAGQVRTSADHIRAELASQMVAPVEWVGSVREMVANGVDTFVEIGPGQVLSRLIAASVAMSRRLASTMPP